WDADELCHDAVRGDVEPRLPVRAIHQQHHAPASGGGDHHGGVEITGITVVRDNGSAVDVGLIPSHGVPGILCHLRHASVQLVDPGGGEHPGAVIDTVVEVDDEPRGHVLDTGCDKSGWCRRSVLEQPAAWHPAI